MRAPCARSALLLLIGAFYQPRPLHWLKFGKIAESHLVFGVRSLTSLPIATLSRHSPQPDIENSGNRLLLPSSLWADAHPVGI
jgi:hypothetical protein